MSPIQPPYTRAQTGTGRPAITRSGETFNGARFYLERCTGSILNHRVVDHQAIKRRVKLQQRNDELLRLSLSLT